MEDELGLGPDERVNLKSFKVVISYEMVWGGLEKQEDQDVSLSGIDHKRRYGWVRKEE